MITYLDISMSRKLKFYEWNLKEKGLSMKYYFAPFEGISWYLYRNLSAKHFEKADVYVTPFIAPNQMREMRESDKKDILPENNKDLHIIPQLIGNRADELVDTARQIHEMGYQEINLNFGCPSGTVVAKNKGAGMLKDLYFMEKFLYEVFEQLPDSMKLSIKTRIGLNDADEWEDILQVFNKFELSDLIIHARIRKDFYKGSPNWDAFRFALECSKNPVCYNGDIWTVADYNRLVDTFPNVSSVMLGRGMLANPALLEEIKGIGKLDKKRLRDYHDEMYLMYQEHMSGDINVLHKMKEIWRYLAISLDKGEEYYKKIGKTKNLIEYKAVINALFAECQLK